MAELPAHVLEAVWAAWRARDTARLASKFSAAGTFVQNVPTEVWPWAGVTIGRRALAQRLEQVGDHFEVVEYEGRITGSDATVARGRVKFRMLHLASGHDLDGCVRHSATVRGGLIVHLEAYYDVERLRAFMRLVSVTA